MGPNVSVSTRVSAMIASRWMMGRLVRMPARLCRRGASGFQATRPIYADSAAPTSGGAAPRPGMPRWRAGARPDHPISGRANALRKKTCKCFTALGAVNVEQALVSTREPLDQPVKIFAALAERLHRDALVLAVGAHVVHVARKPGMPVGRNAGIAQITAVGRGGAHHRDDGHAAPELLGGFLDGAQNLLVERRRCAEHRPG